MGEYENRGWEILAAAGKLEKDCLSRTGCEGCPLSNGGECLVSDSDGRVLPVEWNTGALKKDASENKSAACALKIADRCAAGCGDCPLSDRKAGWCSATGKPSGWNIKKYRGVWRSIIKAKRSSVGNALTAAAALISRRCAETKECSKCQFFARNGDGCALSSRPSSWNGKRQ